jgi:hypothetical protein
MNSPKFRIVPSEREDFNFISWCETVVEETFMAEPVTYSKSR